MASFVQVVSALFYYNQPPNAKCNGVLMDVKIDRMRGMDKTGGGDWSGEI
jgi:hypothetical protein